MMRIAYVCSDPGIPPDGTKGASVHFREFGRALKSTGFAVHGCVARRPAGAFTDFTLEVAESPRTAASRDRISQELRQLTDQAPMLDALSRLPPCDVVYERYSLWGLAGLAYARDRGLPFFLEVNAPLWEEARTFRGLALSGTARAVARDLFAHATRVLVVSKELRERLVREGVPRSRIVHFPNGVAPVFRSSAGAAVRPPVFKGRPVLVFVGSFKPWHGVDFLLRAFKELIDTSDAALWLVGDGPLAASVASLQARHPNRVLRTPAVPHEDVPSILRAADAVVVPYTKDAPHYFCPLKTVEALAVGVPILASDVPANRGLDIEDASVNWFAAGDVRSFLAATRRLLETYDVERERAARLNPQVVDERFTWAQRSRELADMTWNLGSGSEPAGAQPEQRVEVA